MTWSEQLMGNDKQMSYIVLANFFVLVQWFVYILEVGKPVGPLVLELQATFAFLPLPNHTRILELFLVADKQLFVHSSVARPSVWPLLSILYKLITECLDWVQIDFPMRRDFDCANKTRKVLGKCFIRMPRLSPLWYTDPTRRFPMKFYR